MNEFIAFFFKQDVDVALLLFLMVFSCGIAFFHTLIVNFLFDIKVRPGWLFFVLDPIIVGLSFLYRPGYALLGMVCLFASVFPLALVGMIRSAIIRAKKKAQLERNLKRNIKLRKKANSSS